MTGKPQAKGTVSFTVNGMMCAHCAARIQAALAMLPGVYEAAADLETKSIELVIDGNETDVGTLVRATEELGYHVSAASVRVGAPRLV